MKRVVTPIVALDVSGTDAALRLVDSLASHCAFFKIGSELFTAEGPAIVRAVMARGASVFLDLKFHDIPNTVRSAARSAAGLGARLITVHASGGEAMVEAAVRGASEGGEETRVLGVTILTSMEGRELTEAWGRPIGSMQDEVLRLAGLASAGGAHGIVCSGQEAAATHARFGEGLAILVPGVRREGTARHDQARVVSPKQAAEAGARYIVLGRTVTAAESPAHAMAEVLADLS